MRSKPFTDNYQCDEHRPTCERRLPSLSFISGILNCHAGCSKGNRECIYPEPHTAKGHRSRDSVASSQQVSPLSSPEDMDEEKDSKIILGTIPDTEETDGNFYSAKRKFVSPSSVATSPSQIAKKTLSEASSPDDKSTSPSTTAITQSSLAAVPFHVSDCLEPQPRPDWSHLPPDFKTYLDWFTSNITHYHYGLTFDTDDFFRTILPNIALENEALLNAVVGFSAYQITLQNPNGRLHDFLQYYNRSVTLLLQSLRQREKPTVITLLTVLQLATVEVCCFCLG